MSSVESVAEALVKLKDDRAIGPLIEMLDNASKGDPTSVYWPARGILGWRIQLPGQVPARASGPATLPVV